ncbi:hypothetical protein M422DRAFT_254408 [Sphaerobolus stellatus SS14]|uniref:Uncharacterized protein n=1 Tax=Sphaerobolus stellatus (strain SS14) TaxID=990650 RepID=A0A0C9UH17_SPHS4|nr:hypothetical protein M422DRAFT_254408 [Sphaerobolus stellatus SS14]
MRPKTATIPFVVTLAFLLSGKSGIASVVPTTSIQAQELLQYSNATYNNGNFLREGSEGVLLNPLDESLRIQSPLDDVKKCGQTADHKIQDFWYYAMQFQEKALAYSEKILHDAATKVVPAAAEKIREFFEKMKQLVQDCSAFRDEFSNNKLGIRSTLSLKEISAKLSTELNVVLEELQAEFGKEDTVDDDKRKKEREIMIGRALEKIGVALVKVAKSVKANEEAVKTGYEKIVPQLKSILMVLGNLVDEHPVLAETLIFSIVMLLIPEAWLLRPFLSVFGFGPYGPVKGSAAAWAQRRFWGAAIKRGSWFAHLQRAGMTIPVNRLFQALVATGAALGLGSALCSCLVN